MLIKVNYQRGSFPFTDEFSSLEKAVERARILSTDEHVRSIFITKNEQVLLCGAELLEQVNPVTSLE